MTTRRWSPTPKLVLACTVGLATMLAGSQGALALEGRWQGVLRAGPAELRLVMEVTVTEDRLYLGTLTSLDQGIAVLPIDVMEVEGETVRFEVRTIGARYEGRFEEDGTRLAGTWTQGGSLPLEFERTAVAEPPERAAAVDTRASLAADGEEPVELPLHLEVPVTPVPFASGGAIHLAYELHLTNFGASQVSVRRIEVVESGAPRRAGAVVSFEGAELHALLRPVGAAPPEPSRRHRILDLRELPAGRRAIAYLWITLDEEAAIPEALVHRVSARGQTVEGAETAVSRAEAPVLGAPLAGARWMAVNGPGNASIHRRALLPAGGRVSIAQRFAIDWVKLDENGSTFSGDPEENADYYAYGSEVLAVADGVVTDVRDDVPENVPGLTSRAVPMTAQTVTGNYVLLDLGGDRFVFYAHLQPGSILVQPGSRVSQGDVIALVGNSGNSTEPHLHFHVSEGGGGGPASEGVPYVFESFELLEADGTAHPRRNELPLHNAVVRFPDKP